jgi:hypothetical protein
VSIQLDDDLAMLAQLEAAKQLVSRNLGKLSWVDVGRGLMTIHDSRLYRLEFDSFEGCVREWWGWR